MCLPKNDLRLIVCLMQVMGPFAPVRRSTMPFCPFALPLGWRLRCPHRATAGRRQRSSSPAGLTSRVSVCVSLSLQAKPRKETPHTSPGFPSSHRSRRNASGRGATTDPHASPSAILVVSCGERARMQRGAPGRVPVWRSRQRLIRKEDEQRQELRSIAAK